MEEKFRKMHLLREYTNYRDWETEDMRRPRMLSNRPISLGVDCVVSNLGDRKDSKIDVDSGGCLKHKAKSRIGENAKSILRGRIVRPHRLCLDVQDFKGNIPRTGWGAYSSNRETVGWDGEGNNSRIGSRGAKS